jgi:hypothetical protein
MSDDQMFIPDDPGIVIEHEDQEPGFSILQNWVGLADISPTAKDLYWLYVMHADGHRRTEDRLVNPTRETLAEMLGFRKPASVDPYNDELEALGAIQVIKGRSHNRMRARNKYLIKKAPPEGYAGPLNLGDYYGRRRVAREALAAAAAEVARTSGES